MAFCVLKVDRLVLWWVVAFSFCRLVVLLGKPLGHVGMGLLVGLSSLNAFGF